MAPSPRGDFLLSLVFGIDGVEVSPGCCEVLDGGTDRERFADPVVEGHYRVWLAGYGSKALRTRDRLRLAIAQARGYEPRHGSLVNLLKLLQDEGFLPKRPGD